MEEVGRLFVIRAANDAEMALLRRALVYADAPASISVRQHRVVSEVSHGLVDRVGPYEDVLRAESSLAAASETVVVGVALRGDVRGGLIPGPGLFVRHLMGAVASRVAAEHHSLPRLTR
jgi:hypothetical protein